VGRLGVVLVVAAPLLLGACGPGAGSSSVPPSLEPSPPAAAAPAGAASPTAPGIALASGTTVTRDPSLLAILPASIAGVQVTEEAQSFDEAVRDSSFVGSVDRAAFAIAVSGTDLASGVVAHLRPGVYSDAMFADWRASYDEGACAQSGGVAAHAERDAGSRTTYVTTCGGGLRVYHTYLAAKGVIVSLFSTGSADLGGQLVGAIGG
jgi:hypothetical protein